MKLEESSTVATKSSYQATGLKYGVAYYPEYHQSQRTAKDLDLMAAAGLNVIRVGESVWSTWEPRDGEFNLEWLAPVLDMAHERGIGVVLGTPTYAVPPWLQVSYPEIAAETKSGVRVPWGARQEIDFTHPAFRLHAERLIRAIVGRYAGHPAIIGYQVDNEPGLFLLHNHGVFVRFVRWLKAHYGDVENLNREWGLTYWSHRISDWSELWRPDGNTFPQYDLAWRNFQAELTTEFIGWQADLVREYSSSNQFVTTCIQYQHRPAVNDRTLSANLDVAAGNPYYAMQDHLSSESNREPLTSWTTTGVASLFRQADRMYSSKQQRFIVTETNAQAIGGSDMNHPPYPGQLRQAAYALVSRGASMIEYWHWHTLPYGTETYWGGVLPHSLVPGRVYQEVSEIGSEFAKLGDTLDGYLPDADVAILWSTPSRFALEFMPALQSESAPNSDSYQRIFDSFQAGVIAAGRQARVLHVEQAVDLGATELARLYPILVAAGTYISSDQDLQLLRDYVAAGGHLIVGPRTGYADLEARARAEVAPPGLDAVAEAMYEEFSNISAPVPVSGNSKLNLNPDAAAESWIDGLIATGAEVLATYEHPRFADFAAVTSKASGIGRVTLVGCVPNLSLASSIISWASPVAASNELVEGAQLPVYVASGATTKGKRVSFAFNWGWQPQELTLAVKALDPISGESLEAGKKILLTGWSTRILVSQ